MVVEEGRVPAVYRCFDCGAFSNGEAASASFVGNCPTCRMGMILVWELNGEPVNRGYWPEETEEGRQVNQRKEP